MLSMTVFGEVCGGIYPHTDVPFDKTAYKVQKGVYYSPSNQWLAFDVGYVVAGSEHMYFLPGSLFVSACLNARIPIVPILASVESLDEALEYPNDGNTNVYERFDLPEIEHNVMEGVVIRPLMQDIWFGQNRLVLKNKNDKFKEKWRAKKADVSDEVSDVVKRSMMSPLSITTIIGTALPLAIVLSMICWICPCLLQEVSSSPIPCCR